MADNSLIARLRNCNILSYIVVYPFTLEVREIQATKTNEPSRRRYRFDEEFSITRLKAIAQHYDELQYTINVTSYSEWLARWRVKNWVTVNNPFNSCTIEIADVLNIGSLNYKNKYRIIVSVTRKNPSR